MRPLLVVGFAEALSAPEVVFSLMADGFRVRLFTRRGKPSRLARVTGCELVGITPPEHDADAARRDVLAACHDADGLFALDDVSLCLLSALAEQTGSAVHIHATGPQAQVALDKGRQINAARDAGLAVPDGAVLTSAAELADDIRLPAIAKPLLAVREAGGKIVKDDVHYLMTPADAGRFRTAVHLPGPTVVQPLIHGTGEGIFGLATGDGVVGWSGHRRLRMMNPHGSGSSACEQLAPEPDLRSRVQAMMTALNWRGPFMVELLRDAQGTAWFMELNGRVWGSMALARRNGFDYPAWAAQLAMDPAFRPQRGPQRRHSVRHLGRDLLHLLFLVRGPKTEFHRENWPGFFRSLSGVIRPGWPGGFYNFDRSHPFFFIGDAWDTVLAALRRPK